MIKLLILLLFGIAIYKTISDKEFDYGFWAIFVILYSYLVWKIYC